VNEEFLAAIEWLIIANLIHPMHSRDLELTTVKGTTKVQFENFN
jgi:hypothetical protein